jgi:hypothetical protein
MEICKTKTNEIRCPYCRKKQTNILPFYEELGLSKVAGINVRESEKSETVSYSPWITGICCIPKCSFTFVKKNSKDEKIYCSKHTREWNLLYNEYKVIPDIKLHEFTCGTCSQPLKSGKRKGEPCGVTAYTNKNGSCKRHFKNMLKAVLQSQNSNDEINLDENLIVS